MLTPETNPIILGLRPIAGNAVHDAMDWINMKNADGVLITFICYDGGAADFVITVNQGTADGVGETPLVAASTGVSGQEFQIWSNLVTGTTDAMVRRTDAVTYTVPCATTAVGMIVCFYIKASVLSQGYDWLRPHIPNADAASLCVCFYQIVGGRYQQETPPTYIA